jgi:hypothetical protein
MIPPIPSPRWPTMTRGAAVDAVRAGGYSGAAPSKNSALAGYRAAPSSLGAMWRPALTWRKGRLFLTAEIADDTRQTLNKLFKPNVMIAPINLGRLIIGKDLAVAVP